MELMRLYGAPLALAAGAAWLATQELRHFQEERRAGLAPWPRLLRRLAGALILVTVAAMLHLGQTAGPTELTLPQATARLQHWAGVLGLLSGAMALAAWDALAGLRSLRQEIERLEADELQTLRHQLQGRRLG